jgi:hypothetical protein
LSRIKKQDKPDNPIGCICLCAPNCAIVCGEWHSAYGAWSRQGPVRHFTAAGTAICGRSKSLTWTSSKRNRDVYPMSWPFFSQWVCVYPNLSSLPVRSWPFETYELSGVSLALSAASVSCFWRWHL